MSEERVERRLAAILAADVVGYSRLMGADEEGTLAALKVLLRGLGFVEVSADEQKSVLLHARDIVAALLAKRRACSPDIS